MIYDADESHYPELLGIARSFLRESGLPLTYNNDHAANTLWTLIHSPRADVLVDVVTHGKESVVAGCAIICYENQYHNETCAYVDKFFVHKEFRGLGTSDNLLEGIIETAKKRGAALIFSSATAGMGPAVEKLYVRLYERHGFSVLGRIIMRKLR